MLNANLAMEVQNELGKPDPEAAGKGKGLQDARGRAALAKEEGYELSDEELQSISGGGVWKDIWDCDAHCRTQSCWELYHPAV